MTIRRNFKDTVFRMLFSEPENMLSLYNALNDSHYTNASELEVTTLDDAVYMGMKNDCSFVFNQDLNIFEHQSTVNPNMLNLLRLFAEVLRCIIVREEKKESGQSNRQLTSVSDVGSLRIF